MALSSDSSVRLLNEAFGFPLLAGGAPSSGSAHGMLLVANKGNHTVSIVDPSQSKQIATVAETGITTHEVVASPDGRTAYAPIYGNSGVGQPGTDGHTIDVIDLPSRRVISVIQLGRPMRPHCPRFCSKDGMLYVTTELINAVTIIDPKTNKVNGSIPTKQAESHMIAISHDGRRCYTSNVGPGTVSVLDLVNRKTLAVVPVSKTVQRISVSMDDHYAFTADQTRPRVAVIDTSKKRVVRWVELPGVGFGTTPTLDGHYLLATVPGKNKIAVIDLAKWKTVRAISVPAAPQEILMRPDGKVAYVSCDKSRKVAGINLAMWKVDHLIATGPVADGLAWVPARA